MYLWFEWFDPCIAFCRAQRFGGRVSLSQVCDEGNSSSKTESNDREQWSIIIISRSGRFNSVLTDFVDRSKFMYHQSYAKPQLLCCWKKKSWSTFYVNILASRRIASPDSVFVYIYLYILYCVVYVQPRAWGHECNDTFWLHEWRKAGN